MYAYWVSDAQKGMNSCWGLGAERCAVQFGAGIEPVAAGCGELDVRGADLDCCAGNSRQRLQLHEYIKREQDGVDI